VNTQANDVYRKLRDSLKANCYKPDLEDDIINLLIRLSASNVSNIERLELKLRNNAGNKQEFIDFLTEGWAADLFIVNKFNVVYEPCGKAGPDFLVERDGNCLFIEVRRFHENPQEREEIDRARDLGTVIFGTSPIKSVYRLIDAMIEKSRQSIEGKPYVLLIKSMRSWDDNTIAKWAWEGFSENVEKNKVSGMLFDSGWRDSATDQRFYFSSNQIAVNSVNVELIEQLENPTLPPFDSIMQKYGHLYPPV
jgi:hypothetical protein